MSRTVTAAALDESGPTNSLVASSADAPRLGAAGRLRCLLVVGALLAAGAAYVVGDPTAYLQADPKLGVLLRGMAVIKAMVSLAAMSALWWRFGRPIPPATAAVYLVATWMTALTRARALDVTSVLVASAAVTWLLQLVAGTVTPVTSTIGLVLIAAGAGLVIWAGVTRAWQPARRQTVIG